MWGLGCVGTRQWTAQFLGLTCGEPNPSTSSYSRLQYILPTPSNLFCWSKVDTPACVLCSRAGSLKHILSCCPKAQEDGFYQVLKAVTESICSAITRAQHPKPGRQTIPFIKAGAGLLGMAGDWQLLVNLERQF